MLDDTSTYSPPDGGAAHAAPGAEPPGAEWAILEILGHRCRVGLVSEVEKFGTRLLSVEFTEKGRTVTEFYSPGSIFCYTPVPESYVREYDALRADAYRPPALLGDGSEEDTASLWEDCNGDSEVRP